MKCSRCGAQVPQGARFCQGCGAPMPGVSATASEAEASRQQHPAGPSYPPSNQAYQRQGSTVSPMCIASLAVGVASVILIWGPFLGMLAAVAGLVLGVLGMKQVEEDPRYHTGRGLAISGIVVSVAGLVLSSLFNFFVWFRWWW